MGQVQEANMAAIRRLSEAWNNLDRGTFAASYAQPIVLHRAHGDYTVFYGDDETWAEIVESFEVFPDHHVELLGMMADGDHVFVYFEYSGTDSGIGLDGRPPTGKKMAHRGFVDYRLKDGVVVEATSIHEAIDMYRGLGIPVVIGGVPMFGDDS